MLFITVHANLIELIVIHIICFILELIVVLIHIFVIVSYNRILSVEIVRCAVPILRLPILNGSRFVIVFREEPFTLFTTFHKPDLNNRDS